MVVLHAEIPYGGGRGNVLVGFKILFEKMNMTSCHHASKTIQKSQTNDGRFWVLAHCLLPVPVVLTLSLKA